MNARNHRITVLLLALAMVAAPAAESHAGLCDWFSCKKCMPTYAACAPVQQTVSYVPQTCYRCTTVNVPVTALRPCVVADPCTGCQQTTYRPVVTYMPQTRLMPFTTYRVVYSNPCTTCAPACATCAPAIRTGYAPMTGYAMAPAATYAAPSGCSSCGSAAPAYGAAPAYAPSYATSQPMPSYTPSYTTPSQSYPSQSYPSPSYPSQGVPSSTFSNSQAPSTGTQTPQPSLYAPPANYNSMPSSSSPPLKLPPIPDPNTNPASKVNSSSNLRLLDPDNRTTSRPVYQAWAASSVSWDRLASDELRDTSVRPASAMVPVESPAAAALDDGWRPSSR